MVQGRRGMLAEEIVMRSELQITEPRQQHLESSGTAAWGAGGKVHWVTIYRPFGG
jgi:hypothetical protein